MCTTRLKNGAGFDMSRLSDYRAPVDQASKKTAQAKPPGLGRVIGAIIYDGLALIALFMVAGFIFIPLLGRPPATRGEHIVFQVYLFMIAYVFFCWFWTHGGQTLGMRAWKIKLVAENGLVVTWSMATRRFLFALFGLGNLWMLFNTRSRSWHDQLSKTRLIYLPKPKDQEQNKLSKQAP
jgi:uncharacterized RDD family membrane protein YckC